MQELTIDDDLVVRAAANCSESYRLWVERAGRPWRAWDDLILADMGLPVRLPPNHAAMRRPLTDDAVDDVVDRMRTFFDGSPGGGYQLWSLWSTPDLSGLGFEPWGLPLMIRSTGGDAGPAPRELEISEVDDDRSAREASVILTAFGSPPEATESIVKPSMWDEDFRFWIGRVDGRPVSISAAAVSHGFVGIYAVATDPAFRGHGYGEALTWVATMSRPDLPATLQASRFGRPIYERMGYETVTTFHSWQIDRRPG